MPSRGRHCWVPASPGKADVLEGTSRVCRISAVSKSELRFTRGKRCVHDSVAEGTFNILPTAPAPCVNAGAGSGAGAACLRAGEGVQCPLSRPRAGQAEAWRLRSHWGTLTTHFPPLKSGQVKAQRQRRDKNPVAAWKCLTAPQSRRPRCARAPAARPLLQTAGEAGLR